MGRRTTRREWLAHCSLLGLGPGAAQGPWPPQPRRRRPCSWSATASRPSTASRAQRLGGAARAAPPSEKIAATVVNASVSGDTTGRSLAPAALLAQHRPTHAWSSWRQRRAARPAAGDDARQPPAIVKACRDAGAKVVLLGMQVPPTTAANTATSSRHCSPASPRPAARAGALHPRRRGQRTERRALFQPTASTRWPRPTRACWPTSGRCSRRC